MKRKAIDHIESDDEKRLRRLRRASSNIFDITKSRIYPVAINTPCLIPDEVLELITIRFMHKKKPNEFHSICILFHDDKNEWGAAYMDNDRRTIQHMKFDSNYLPLRNFQTNDKWFRKIDRNFFLPNTKWKDYLWSGAARIIRCSSLVNPYCLWQHISYPRYYLIQKFPSSIGPSIYRSTLDLYITPVEFSIRNMRYRALRAANHVCLLQKCINSLDVLRWILQSLLSLDQTQYNLTNEHELDCVIKWAMAGGKRVLWQKIRQKCSPITIYEDALNLNSKKTFLASFGDTFLNL